MSAALSRGWDRTETDDTAPSLCTYHAQVTERLSDYHAGQIAKQCPQCVAVSRHISTTAVNLTA